MSKKKQKFEFFSDFLKLMKKFFQNSLCFLLCLSALVLTVYLITLFIKLLNTDAFDCDYLDSGIEAMALLVTVLIGWNIYTVIDTKKVLNDAEKRYKDFQEKTENNIQRIRRKTDKELKKIRSKSKELSKNFQKSIEDIGKEGDFNSAWIEGEIRFHLEQYLAACECYLSALMKDIPQTDKNNAVREEIKHRIGSIGRRLGGMQKIKESKCHEFIYACDFDINHLFNETYTDYKKQEEDKALNEYVNIIKNIIEEISYKYIHGQRFLIYRKAVGVNEVKYGIYALMDKEFKFGDKIYTNFQEYDDAYVGTLETEYEYIGVCSCQSWDDQHRVFEELKKVGSGSVELAADSNKTTH